jgi:hypothetical protein
MIKGILGFVVLSCLIAAGIQAFRQVNYLEKWQLVKTLSYGAMCSALALIILGAVVIIF